MWNSLKTIRIWLLRKCTRANKDMLGYFCVYLAKYKISKEDLEGLCYLADWKSSIEYGRTISYSKYEFLLNGIYSNLFDYRILLGDKKVFKKMFKLNFRQEFYVVPNPKKINFDRFTKEEKEVLDFVIKIFIEDKGDRKRIRHLILSTYPAMNSNREEILDLPKLAKEYNKIKHLI